VRAYYVGMKRHPTRQYTIRSVPAALDRELRQQSRRQGKSLNEVALDALTRGAGHAEEHRVFTDLDDCIGTWDDDPGFAAALAAQDVVEPSAWH
jgi:hypothetical protein